MIHITPLSIPGFSINDGLITTVSKNSSSIFYKNVPSSSPIYVVDTDGPDIGTPVRYDPDIDKWVSSSIEIATGMAIEDAPFGTTEAKVRLFPRLVFNSGYMSRTEYDPSVQHRNSYNGGWEEAVFDYFSGIENYGKIEKLIRGLGISSAVEIVATGQYDIVMSDSTRGARDVDYFDEFIGPNDGPYQYVYVLATRRIYAYRYIVRFLEQHSFSPSDSFGLHYGLVHNFIHPVYKHGISEVKEASVIELSSDFDAIGGPLLETMSRTADETDFEFIWSDLYIFHAATLSPVGTAAKVWSSVYDSMPTSRSFPALSRFRSSLGYSSSKSLASVAPSGLLVYFSLDVPIENKSVISGLVYELYWPYHSLPVNESAGATISFTREYSNFRIEIGFRAAGALTYEVIDEIPANFIFKHEFTSDPDNTVVSMDIIISNHITMSDLKYYEPSFPAEGVYAHRLLWDIAWERFFPSPDSGSYTEVKSWRNVGDSQEYDAARCLGTASLVFPPICGAAGALTNSSTSTISLESLPAKCFDMVSPEIDNLSISSFDDSSIGLSRSGKFYALTGSSTSIKFNFSQHPHYTEEVDTAASVVVNAVVTTVEDSYLEEDVYHIGTDTFLATDSELYVLANIRATARIESIYQTAHDIEIPRNMYGGGIYKFTVPPLENVSISVPTPTISASPPDLSGVSNIELDINAENSGDNLPDPSSQGFSGSQAYITASLLEVTLDPEGYDIDWTSNASLSNLSYDASTGDGSWRVEFSLPPKLGPSSSYHIEVRVFSPSPYTYLYDETEEVDGVWKSVGAIPVLSSSISASEEGNSSLPDSTFDVEVSATLSGQIPGVIEIPNDFVCEVEVRWYLDMGRTQLVGSSSASAVWDGSVFALQNIDIPKSSLDDIYVFARYTLKDTVIPGNDGVYISKQSDFLYIGKSVNYLSSSTSSITESLSSLSDSSISETYSSLSIYSTSQSSESDSLPGSLVNPLAISNGDSGTLDLSSAPAVYDSRVGWYVALDLSSSGVFTNSGGSGVGNDTYIYVFTDSSFDTEDYTLDDNGSGAHEKISGNGTYYIFLTTYDGGSSGEVEWEII